MHNHAKEALYIYTVLPAAVGAQMLAGAAIAKLAGQRPLHGALAGLGLMLANETFPRHTIELGPVRSAALAPALAGEWAANKAVRPLLGWKSKD